MYKGRYGEIIIDPHLYKPCCQRKPELPQEEGGEMKKEMKEQTLGKNALSMSPSPTPKQEVKVEEREHGDGCTGLV